MQLLLFLIAGVLISCRQKQRSDQTNGNDDLWDRNAKAYLQTRLQMGASTNAIIERFGVPINQYETATHELSLYFYFSRNDHEANRAGVGGFVGFFTNNQLERWEPVYRGSGPTR